MRRIVSSLLLLASAAVFMGSAGVVVAVLAARDAAMWLGGWGLLMLGQPIVTIGLLCLVFGLALRWMSVEPEEDVSEPAKMQYRLAGWGLIWLGILVIADHIVKVVVFAMISQVDLGAFAFLPVLGPKLPLGFAAIFLGLVVLRRAPRQSDAPVFAPVSMWRSA